MISLIRNETIKVETNKKIIKNCKQHTKVYLGSVWKETYIQIGFAISFLHYLEYQYTITCATKPNSHLAHKLESYIEL